MTSSAMRSRPERPVPIPARPGAQRIFARKWALGMLLRTTTFLEFEDGDELLASVAGMTVDQMRWYYHPHAIRSSFRDRELLDVLERYAVTIADILCVSVDRVVHGAEDDEGDAIELDAWLGDTLVPVVRDLRHAPLVAAHGPGVEQLLAESLICRWLPSLRVSDLRADPDLARDVAAFLGPPSEEEAIWHALKVIAVEDAERYGRIHGNRLVLRLASLEHALQQRVRLLRDHLRGIGDRVELREVAHSRRLEGLEQQERLRLWLDEAFEGLYGMHAARAFLHDIGLLSIANGIHRAAGAMRAPRLHRHIALVGPPGVGKTTFARRYGRFLHQVGAIERDHTVEIGARDLVGRYVGSTTPLVREMCAKARGGVLFIDEAYALHGDSKRDFGHEALVALMQAIDQADAALTVVLAGYQEPIARLLDANPGLRSRIGTVVRFEPLSAQESGLLLQRLACEDDVEVDGQLLDCWLGLDLVCRLPTDGRVVQLLYRQLLAGPVARRACETQQRLSLRVEDLACLDLPARQGVNKLFAFNALDDEAS